MASNGTTSAVDVAIAAGDSHGLRKLAFRAQVAETRMLQLLVADLIDRQARLRRKYCRAEHPLHITGAA